MSGLKEFGESAARSVLERIGRGVSRVQERKPLPYDMLESDEAYLVVFDAPGVQRSDVQVRFLDGEVQVRIDRFRDFHEGFEMRFPGRGLSLDGSAALPDDAAVDATDAKATLTANGTLRVEIPKDERARDVAVTDESEADADGRTDAADDTRAADGSDGAETYETDVDEDEAGESVDATGSATGVSATDTADGVGSTDSTDVDADTVDRDVASSDPDRDGGESGDDEGDEEDDYEMSSVEETVAESDGETVEGDTDPDEDRS